jgi:hypothetical protein
LFATPNTLLIALARLTSDHIHCVAQIKVKIPKANIFKFENYWVQHPGFFDIVQ